MKIFKAIKLFKKLRKRQEILYNEIVEHSTRNYLEYPKLDEYASVNKAVHTLLPYRSHIEAILKPYWSQLL